MFIVLYLLFETGDKTMPATLRAKDPCRAISIAVDGELSTSQVRVLKALSKRSRPLTRVQMENAIRVDDGLPSLEFRKDGKPKRPIEPSKWRGVGRWADELWDLETRGLLSILIPNQGEKDLRHVITAKGRKAIERAIKLSKK